jgi:glycopeptide antibiotics resistance protein
MPNVYQWIVFICTVIVLFLEITNLNFGGRTSRIDTLLLVALTVGVGFFLYRVAGKAKKKKPND